jgi:hypothetical protein
MKKKFYPTCRVCDKLNETMTHCTVYGPISPENLDNTAIGAACQKSGDYVRFIHAVPNEFNYQDPSMDELNNQLLVYSRSDEEDLFLGKHGMTLEEWAKIAFRKER